MKTPRFRAAFEVKSIGGVYGFFSTSLTPFDPAETGSITAIGSPGSRVIALPSKSMRASTRTFGGRPCPIIEFATPTVNAIGNRPGISFSTIRSYGAGAAPDAKR